MNLEKQLDAQLESEIEEAWQEHLLENDWGSGKDRIKITDEMYNEFKDNYLENQYQSHVESLVEGRRL
jgi:hypothetical protein